MEDIREQQTFEADKVDQEFTAATTTATFCDRSSVGKLLVSGAEALDLLHRLSTNDIRGLKAHRATGTVFTTAKGRIVDFARVISLPDSVLLTTGGTSASRLKEWVSKYTIMEDVKTTDVTSSFAMYSIIGPHSDTTVEQLFQCSFVPETVHELHLADSVVIVDMLSDFETHRANILIPQDHAKKLSEALKRDTRALGIMEMGEQGYEAFRISQGIPRGDAELVDSFNPFETGLRPFISTTKGCYIGQEVVARLDTYDKIQRKLVRITYSEGHPPLSERLSLTHDGDGVGLLTSVASAPIKGEYFGLGVVSKAKVSVGNTLAVLAGGLEYKGVVSRVFDRSFR